MRKAIAVGLIAALALAAPIADGAAPAKRYKGEFGPGGELSFKVKKRNGNKKVIKLAFSAFPVDCSSGPQTTSGNLRFVLPVNAKNRFRANGIVGNPDSPKARLKLRGKLQGARRAKGTMQVDGSKVLIDAGGTDACDSPKTRWTAAKT